MITKERLMELLEYNPYTGLFYWKESRGRVKQGSLAGTLDKDGYTQIRVDSVLYRAHRLQFLYMTGAWPRQLVDHKDRVRTNNQWDNLREQDGVINAQNTTMKSTNTSGFPGVHKKGKSWQQRTRDDLGVRVTLGCYPTPQEAYQQILEFKEGLYS